MSNSRPITPFEFLETQFLTHSTRSYCLFDVSGRTPVGLDVQPSDNLVVRRGFHYGMRRPAHAFDSISTVGSLDGGTLWN